MARLKINQRQAREVIKCGKDPHYFINKYVKILSSETGHGGLVPFITYPFQDDCLDEFIKHRFNVIVKSRQLGLSTLAAAYALWLALFHRGQNILIIATKLATAQNFIGKVKDGLKSLPKWLVVPQIQNSNKTEVSFNNGSKVKAIPTSPDAGRSEALSLLIVDEAAFIRDFAEIWKGIYPTLSHTKGKALVISTPNGTGGRYHKIYTEAEAGNNEFNAIRLPWDVHPDRDDEWFNTQAANMSPRGIAQELECNFESSGNTVISKADIDWIASCIRPPAEKRFHQAGFWIWKYPLRERRYIVSADVATGEGKDYSTCHVIDTDDSEVVAEYQGKIRPDMFAEMLYEIGIMYNKALIAPERNSWGYATTLTLKTLQYPNLYSMKRRRDAVLADVGVNDKQYGFSTQGHNRPAIIAKLEELIRNKAILIPSSRFYHEATTFVWRGTKPRAMRDNHDDLIISLAIGCWLYEASPMYGKNSRDVNKHMLSGFGRDGHHASDMAGAKDEVRVPHNHSPYDSIGMLGAPGEVGRRSMPRQRLRKEWRWII